MRQTGMVADGCEWWWRAVSGGGL